ncbi:DNA-directed RNA polymerase subunit omega [Radiobacillus deserti]|uniref:DNA-directed RNA polymerase subunit omega n=1 Tax=Radiobacillus deserti TaxID=2594883 RepID=A0A516KFI6_9BACI|nr:DNA-directed RNA polymerase subunit omega [Radiobacillus deserti]QDP40127.1 DNA-directed RNA polymerase subunit omega [Radiobacillus deserti]
MMLEPSIDALQEKINSKYTLVTLSARRARQMQETKQVLIENPKSHKYVGLALEEIQADKLYYEAAEE